MDARLQAAARSKRSESDGLVVMAVVLLLLLLLLPATMSPVIGPGPTIWGQNDLELMFPS